MDNQQLTPSYVWDSWIKDEQDSPARVIRYWPGGLIIAALDGFNSPELWIEFQQADPSDDNFAPFEQRVVRGLALSVEQVTVDGRKFKVLNVKLADSKFIEEFTAFADLLVDDFFRDSNQKGLLVEAEIKITKWMDFFKAHKDSVSREAILGLLGELSFIKNWLNHNDADYKIWVGPFGESKDFVGPNIDIEVKVCGSRTGPLVHKISSIDQLQASTEKQLYLYSLRAVIGHNKDKKIQDLIEEVRSLPMFRKNLAAVNYFNDALLRYGLGSEIPVEYSTFEALEEGVYLVDEGFPKISKDIILDIPEIVGVQYSIDITARSIDSSFQENNLL